METMLANDIIIKRNSGTSQAQRQLDALGRDYVKVDERTPIDFALFAKKYSKFIYYFDQNNQQSGDWSNFMSDDVAVLIATVAKWPTTEFSKYVDKLNKTEKHHGIDTNLKYLFDFVFSVAHNIIEISHKLPADIRYYNFLQAAISSKLNIPLAQLDKYFKELKLDATLKNDKNLPFISIPYNPAPIEIVTRLVVTGLPHNGDRNAPSWPKSQKMIFQVATEFINGITYIVTESLKYFDEIIGQYPNHSPHYALYLAFLKLYQVAQSHLNEYTVNHLGFYYKKVLQLKNSQGEADHVFLLFQLQNNLDTDDFPLAKGTVFSAGKDVNKNDIFYSLTDHVLLNKGSVKSLKSLYLLQNSALEETLYALPVANSQDGAGAPLTSVDKSWYAFGDPMNISNGLTTPAVAGFAIMSDLLFLNDGPRSITLTIRFNNQVSDLTNLAQTFSFLFTGDKNWFDALDFPDRPSPGNNTGASNVMATKKDNYTLEFKIVISHLAPPIVPYTQKVHGGSFIRNLPIVKVLINTGTDKANSYDGYKNYAILKALLIKTIQIDVSAVITQGVTLQNDDGIINATKPFKPFGEFPDGGASFIFGSKEMFQKPLTSLTVKFDWQDVLTTSPVPSGKKPSVPAVFSILSSGHWLPEDAVVSTLGQTPFNADAGFLTAHSNPFMAGIDFTPNQPYKSSAKDGFGRFRLQDTYTVYSKQSYINAVSNITVTFTATGNAGGNMGGSVGGVPVSGGNTGSPPLGSIVGKVLNSPVINTARQILESGRASAGAADSTGNPGLPSTGDGGSPPAGSPPISSPPVGSPPIGSPPVASPPVSSPPVGNGTTVNTVTIGPPNVEFTFSPVANSVSFSYTASSVLFSPDEMTEKGFNERTQLFYHLEPFGFRELHPFLLTRGNNSVAAVVSKQKIVAGGQVVGNSLNFLPVFDLDQGINESSKSAGEFWIGLENIQPGSSASLLFKLADGTSSPSAGMTRILNWYYLSGDNWVKFDTGWVVDNTSNFSVSGIVVINIPSDADIIHSRADSGLIWAKAVVEGSIKGICKFISVTNNAGKAGFVLDPAKNITFANNIIANTISKPVISNPAIKQISQPYPSFGGSPAETDADFNLRTSERLRHKNRAITTWDYERLILMQFPQIFKVKCLNHTGFTNELDPLTYSENLPGHVMVVTIPNLAQTTAANLQCPSTDSGSLEEIKDYLSQLVSPFVKPNLKVCNPQFEGIQLELNVVFSDNSVSGYYVTVLRNDIVNFLTPWAHANSSKDIDFGSTIEKSALVNFIQCLNYVSAVNFCKMNQYIPVADDKFRVNSNIEVATASTNRSILVSSYNVQHSINKTLS